MDISYSLGEAYGGGELWERGMETTISREWLAMLDDDLVEAPRRPQTASYTWKSIIRCRSSCDILFSGDGDEEAFR